MLSDFEVNTNNAPYGFFIKLTTEDNVLNESGALVARKVGQKQYELKGHLF